MKIGKYRVTFDIVSVFLFRLGICPDCYHILEKDKNFRYCKAGPKKCSTYYDTIHCMPIKLLFSNWINIRPRNYAN